MECFIQNDVETQKISSLPVLFWIILPVCFWRFANNIEENIMSFFYLLSVWFSLKAISENKFIWICISAMVIVLSVLTKGVQGSFVLMFPFFCSLFNSHNKLKMQVGIGYLFVLFFMPLIIFLLMFLDDEIIESLTRYFLNRVVNSIQNVSNVENRFYILGRLFVELCLPLALALIIGFISKKQNKFVDFKQYKNKALAFSL